MVAGFPAVFRPSFRVLHDDGLQLIARATEEDAEALAVAGFGIARIPDHPMSFREKPEAPGQRFSSFAFSSKRTWAASRTTRMRAR